MSNALTEHAGLRCWCSVPLVNAWLVGISGNAYECEEKRDEGKPERSKRQTELTDGSSDPDVNQ